ncbi:MAG: hypothetical protein HY744_02820 [Deltaproteobacteria bacterium]|nr:hypothetical protein [Deltaproteobacteria bacterium]
MKHSKAARRRCTECRHWFHPAASAQATQLVCGPDCRRKRDLALARRRRARDLDRYRENEQDRQHKCREARRRRAGIPPPPVRLGREGAEVADGHAPASGANQAQLQEKVLQSWDKVAARSRDSLIL